jgi:methanogenic corrinoid protein MtbC1
MQRMQRMKTVADLMEGRGIRKEVVTLLNGNEEEKQ